MAGSDLPEGTANDTSAPLDFEDGVDALAELFEAPETDLNEKQGSTEEAKAEAETEGEQPDEEADDEALDLEADPDSPDEADGSEEIKGGQFAPGTAKTKLPDGTVITVAELVRNNLFQRDYTFKTEELKAERTAVEAEKQSVQAQAQEASQIRDFVLSNWQDYLGQPPEMPSYDPGDPLGYMEAKADYDQRLAAHQQRLDNLNQLYALQQQEKAKAGEEEARNYQQTVQREVGQLIEKIPYLKEPGKMEKFRTEVVDALAPYGFSADEIGTVVDHRMLLVAKDIVRLQKALKKSPEVKQQVQQRPKLISGGKRMDPKARTSREADARNELLRKTGSFDAGVASLMDLDL